MAQSEDLRADFIQEHVDAAAAFAPDNPRAGADVLTLCDDLLTSVDNSVSAATVVLMSFGPGRFIELVTTDQVDKAREIMADRIEWIKAPALYRGPGSEVTAEELERARQARENALARFALKNSKETS